MTWTCSTCGQAGIGSEAQHTCPEWDVTPLQPDEQLKRAYDALASARETVRMTPDEILALGSDKPDGPEIEVVE